MPYRVETGYAPLLKGVCIGMKKISGSGKGLRQAPGAGPGPAIEGHKAWLDRISRGTGGRLEGRVRGSIWAAMYGRAICFVTKL